ncbi:MAG: hypothetical protein II117_03100 [Clostridia bacterium]|nr:hypothetical protein [Clostridia bacterium]
MARSVKEIQIDAGRDGAKTRRRKFDSVARVSIPKKAYVSDHAPFSFARQGS